MILLSVYLVAALISTISTLPQQNAPEKRISPCPELFRYESVDQAGQWTGNLLVDAEDELHGVWIRLIFDSPFKEINVDGDFEVGTLDNVDGQVLIKNKNHLLKPGSPTNVKITLKYEGSKFPQLIGYRLNAKTLCPHPETTRVDYFQGDDHSKDLLTDILLPITPIDQSGYTCGLKPIEPSPTSQLPWAADLYIRDKGAETYACSATLISPSYLVTAAHCVTFKNAIERVPAYKLVAYLVENLESIKSRAVSRIHVHPAYDPDTLFNDIAVIKIDTPVEINDNIRPICLKERSSSDNKLTLIGYEVEDNGILSSKQIETDVKRIEARECKERAPKLENILGEDSYCLSYISGNSGCAGDSGSSLVTFKDNIATLKGIVKVGVLLQNKTRCEDDAVLLATNIDRHLKWISRIAI